MTKLRPREGQLSAPATRRIEDVPNLGPFTAKRLAEIGVTNEGELRAMGAVAAYHRLKFLFGRGITLNALWGHGCRPGRHRLAASSE
jgi:hypothetical protein